MWEFPKIRGTFKGDILGLYRDNGKENGYYYLGFRVYRVSENSGYPFGGPHNKDYSILGSILGSPYFGKLPCPTFNAKPTRFRNGV